MAGAGYKLFSTGDVLSASDVNTYLQQQTVMVFASAAARTTALASVLAEGMVTYLKDTDVVEIYTGAAWVSLDDPNAIQNSIVDAKGDIITATADNTPARLAVGATNGMTLQVDSTAATGLKWATPASSSPLTTKGDLFTYSTADARLAIGADYGFLQALASASTGNQWNSGAWTSYTPTVTPEAGAITSYTVQRSAYVRVGKLCVVNLNITITNKGTGSGALFVSAPFNSYNDAGSGVGREIAVVGTMLYSSMGSNNFQIRKYDATTVLVNNYVCALTIVYEVA